MQMRRRMMATLAVGAMALGTMAMGPGNGGGPGPFGPNNFGLCTAWAASENGRENGRAGEAPPFQALQDEAEAADQSVEEWCAENGQHPGGGNGQGRS
jgi:hypothetical protein